MNSEGAASVITKYIDPMNNRSVDQIDRLLVLQRQAAQATMQEAEREDWILMRLLLGMSVIAIAVGAFISWRITRSIAVPLEDALKVAKRVASGDLTSEISNGHRDEIGNLLNALATMNHSLQDVIGKVHETSASIDTETHRLVADNGKLSTRIESQAAAVQETASAIEQLTLAVRQNADNARQADILASSACSVAAQGGAVVDDMVMTALLQTLTRFPRLGSCTVKVSCDERFQRTAFYRRGHPMGGALVLSIRHQLP